MKNVKILILQEVRRKGSLKSSDISRKFMISRQAAHKHLIELARSGKIIKQGSTRSTTCYVYNGKHRENGSPKLRPYRKRVQLAGSSEDSVFDEIKSRSQALFENLSKECAENIRYAFTEMFNNAIDHSGSKFAEIEFANDGMRVWFKINDAGIGIFENIRQKNRLNDELSAIQDLLKGKHTTMPEKHSGEGIFFTSKIAGRFILESHKKRIIIDNNINDIFLEDIRQKKGTSVQFESDVNTRRTVLDIFKKFTNEDFKFDKSMVSVKLFNSEGAYISRSQAKRILHSLENFGRIVLDFKEVKVIGQAFADEIFRVFKQHNSAILIEWVNANENIEFMIRRAVS